MKGIGALQSILDILESPYLEDDEKVNKAIDETMKVSKQVAEDIEEIYNRYVL